jgi:hypothetical protein
MSDTLATMAAGPDYPAPDPGAGGIDIGAQLAVSIGGLSAATASLSREMALQRARNHAVRYIKPPPLIGVVPASGALVMKLLGPELGYQWTVRKISVADPAGQGASVAGVAGVYAGVISADALGPGQVGPQVENLEWLISPLPNVADFGSDQLVLQAQENLYVVLTGGTPAQNIRCSVAYQLYRPGQPTDDTQT